MEVFSVSGRTYGRGSGERAYRPIPIPPFRPKVSRLFESGHAAYPQTGVYASSEPKVLECKAGDGTCR